jgi:hypothetical protein
VPLSLDGQVFHVRNITRICDHGASVSATSCGADMLRLLCRAGKAGASFGKNHFGVGRVYPLIGRTMKNNGANVAMRALETTLPLHRRWRTRDAAHGSKCRSYVGGGSIGEAGVNASWA